MKILCKNKYWNINKEYNSDKILYLLIDRPNYINSFNDFVWKNKNGYHREYDLPAYTNINCGALEWHTSIKIYK